MKKHEFSVTIQLNKQLVIVDECTLNSQSLPTGMFKVAQHVSICKYYSFRNPNSMDADKTFCSYKVSNTWIRR